MPMRLNRRQRWLAVASLVVVSSCQVSEEGAAGELGNRLTSTGSDRFGFEYRAGGTAVLDCMLANRRFHVTVDREAGTLELRRNDIEGATFAISSADDVLLHRSAFAGSSIPTEWVWVPGTPGTSEPEEIKTALGADAASYVLSPGLPDDASGMVRSLLEAATKVSHLETTPDDLPRVDGYRLELPGNAVDAPGPQPAKVVIVDIWIDADDVIHRITVGERGAEAVGWTLNFTRAAARTTVGMQDVTAVADVEALRPAAPEGCALDVS